MPGVHIDNILSGLSKEGWVFRTGRTILEPGAGFEPATCGLRVRRPAELGYPGTRVIRAGGHL